MDDAVQLFALRFICEDDRLKFFLSSEPSGNTNSWPKNLVIFVRAGVLGSTTWRAMMSTSMIETSWALRIDETVDM